MTSGTETGGAASHDGHAGRGTRDELLDGMRDGTPDGLRRSTPARRTSTRPGAHHDPLPLDLPQWVVIDTETTGLGADDRIIEIAALAVDARSMEITDRLVTLLNPGRDTGPEAVHGISTHMVATAPRFLDIAADLADFLSGRVLVAHNLEFDRRFLAAEFERAGTPIDLGLGFCTWRQGRMLTLAASCDLFNIDLQGAHRAEADAIATLALLGHLDERHLATVRPAMLPQPHLL